MTPTQKVRDFEFKNYGEEHRFDHLEEPGAYLSKWSGHLIRVPDDALKPGRSPLIEILGKEPMVVTKISDNPYITITKARMIAADLDLEVNF